MQNKNVEKGLTIRLNPHYAKMVKELKNFYHSTTSANTVTSLLDDIFDYIGGSKHYGKINAKDLQVKIENLNAMVRYQSLQVDKLSMLIETLFTFFRYAGTKNEIPMDKITLQDIQRARPFIIKQMHDVLEIEDKDEK
ncbi:MAG: hypothetical protein LBF00_01915 [Mycoplasmataceae bacterium]|jgi:hypothetical protein|nr:hypothetical protein [Mycoplasmataceae bacterium]